MSLVATALRGAGLAFILAALASCGGGGGGNGSTVPATPSPPPPPPPPPSGKPINGAFSFNPVIAYPPRTQIIAGEYSGESVAIGDVTGDGRPDVVMVTEGWGSGATPPELMRQVMLFPQLPDKTLGLPIMVTYLDHDIWRQTGMTIGDLNGDGAKEVIVGHQDGLSIATYQANTQTLKLATIPDPTGGYTAVTAADVDADGRVDVIAQTWDAGADLYKGDGLGGLTRSTDLATPLAGYNRVIAQDMNRDNKPDLVMTNGQGFQQWYLMLNDGKSSYLNAASYEIPRRQSDNWPWMAWGVDTGDMNLDGRRDVVVSMRSNRPAGIGVYLAKPDGSYELDRVLESYDSPEPVVLADFDGNGLLDIVTVHGGWYDMGYYLHGTGGYEAEKRMSISFSWSPTSHYRPDGLAAGDINSDGCTDVVIADNQFGLLVLTGANCKQ